MTMAGDHNSRIKTEHRVYWASQETAALPAGLRRLKGFFVRYGRKHLRNFPWRHAGTEPFHLLVAELLLVQTKADDVAHVWPKLISRYRTPARLARARPETLIRLLRPLGLQRQRARGLVEAARALLDAKGGEMPQTVDQLLALPHVGLYAATAVASFGFHRRVPIVDANVVRVFDRITGVQGNRELRRRGDVWGLAWAILPRTNAHLHNYGLLDFAATICMPRAPRCGACNLCPICTYGQQHGYPRPIEVGAHGVIGLHLVE